MIALARRTVPDCLSEELRRLDADDVYGEALAAVGQISRGRSSGPSRERPEPSPERPEPSPERPEAVR
jgi:glucose-6-phosphate dehydrogenase assembly protein OpcA